MHTQMTTMSLPETFSCIQLRTGKTLGNSHEDEPLWDLPSELQRATDLILYPASFCRIYNTFASHCTSERFIPWSAAASYAFVSGMSATATEWIPIMLQHTHSADSAGFIALQICFYCNQAAYNAINYPNTRSYKHGSYLRESQTALLQDVIKAFQQIIYVLRQPTCRVCY